METLAIHSNLSSISKLKGIASLTEKQLLATTSFELNDNKGSKMEQIEAMAQAASYHFKQKLNFSAHTFLASIAELHFSQEVISGIFTIGSTPWNDNFLQEKIQPQAINRYHQLLSEGKEQKPNLTLDLLSSTSQTAKYKVQLS